MWRNVLHRALQMNTPKFLLVLFRPCSQKCVPRPGAAKLRPASRIRPAKYLAHFFKHHCYGQQCDSIGCCLSRKSHYIRPSSGQAVANSALGSISLEATISKSGLFACKKTTQRVNHSNFLFISHATLWCVQGHATLALMTYTWWLARRTPGLHSRTVLAANCMMGMGLVQVSFEHGGVLETGVV